jgi:hypothetical protein
VCEDSAIHGLGAGTQERFAGPSNGRPGGGDVIYQKDRETTCTAKSGEASTWKLETTGARIARLPVKPVTSQQRHHRFVETATDRGSQQVRRRPGAAKTPKGMGRHPADGVD